MWEIVYFQTKLRYNQINLFPMRNIIYSDRFGNVKSLLVPSSDLEFVLDYESKMLKSKQDFTTEQMKVKAPKIFAYLNGKIS